jgi:hypothetical protein
MGLMVDTNVFIRFEKSGKTIDLSHWESSERLQPRRHLGGTAGKHPGSL